MLHSLEDKVDNDEKAKTEQRFFIFANIYIL